MSNKNYNKKHPTTIAKEVKPNRYFPPQKERKSPTRISLSAREFRIGRTYEDFQKFTKLNPT